MTERVGLLERAKAAGRAHLDDAEQRSFDKLLGEIAALDDPIDEVREELKRAGRGAPRVQYVRDAQRGGGVTEARAWAEQTGNLLLKLGGEAMGRAVLVRHQAPRRYIPPRSESPPPGLSRICPSASRP
jgi:hypothetical protein